MLSRRRILVFHDVGELVSTVTLTASDTVDVLPAASVARTTCMFAVGYPSKVNSPGAIRANQAVTLGHNILEDFDGGILLSSARNCHVARIVTAVVGRGGDHQRIRRDRVDGLRAA